MTKLILSASAAALFVLPTLASAQALPAPVIAVVDLQRASSQCNACKTALTQLESQVASFRTLQTSLEASVRTEGAALQTAVNALAGRQPDAALNTRIQAFERKQADAQRQLTARDQTFQRNRAHVLQQIGAKIDPILTSVLAQRRATVMLDVSNVIRSAPSIDVTADVIAGLNASLTTVSTTAPAQAQQPAPAGR